MRDVHPNVGIDLEPLPGLPQHSFARYTANIAKALSEIDQAPGAVRVGPEEGGNGFATMSALSHSEVRKERDRLPSGKLSFYAVNEYAWYPKEEDLSLCHSGT